MKILTRFLFMAFVWFGSSMAHAEITTYESTENAGQNKKERIDSVEGYLINLSSSLQKMEKRLDENAKKIEDLGHIVKALKASEAKRIDAKLGEIKVEEDKKTGPKTPEKIEPSELDKLKADIMAMKNQDIEKLKTNLEELSDTVKAIQATLKKE